MKCEICGLEEAVIHVKQTIDEVESEMHLCENCAALKGISVEESESKFSMHNLLTGLVDIDSSSKIADKKKVCPTCKLSYKKFQKQIKLGCVECFTVFREEIDYILEKMYGQYQHNGKYPEYLVAVKNCIKEIEELNIKLKEALKYENFEEAAKIRDRINELRENRDHRGKINV